MTFGKLRGHSLLRTILFESPTLSFPTSSDGFCLAPLDTRRPRAPASGASSARATPRLGPLRARAGSTAAPSRPRMPGVPLHARALPGSGRFAVVTRPPRRCTPPVTPLQGAGYARVAARFPQSGAPPLPLPRYPSAPARLFGARGTFGPRRRARARSLFDAVAECFAPSQSERRRREVCVAIRCRAPVHCPAPSLRRAGRAPRASRRRRASACRRAGIVRLSVGLRRLRNAERRGVTPPRAPAGAGTRRLREVDWA